MEINISTLAKHFTDEASAWEMVEKMRWPNGPVCPHCGDTGRAYFLTPKAPRTTSTGRVSYRRTWKCAECRKKFSVLVGTIFEGTKIPLSKWLLAVYLMAASKNGVAAFELHRTLGVTHKTAWFMIHRIREGMKLAPFAAMMSGTVVADEAWIGGMPKWKHAHKRYGVKGLTDKQPILSLVDTGTGEVRSQVVPDVTGHTLRKAIADQVVMAATTLHTDSAGTYKTFSADFAKHEMVNHLKGEFVRDGVSTNRAENYFGQLKRSVNGAYHHVSVRQLPRYLAEFDFRYSTCKLTDSERMVRLMGQTGDKRLTYARLTAKA